HVVILPACTIGLLSVAVLNLNNMRDWTSDAKANKNTLVVKWGFKKAKTYHFMLVVGAIVLSFAFSILYYNSPFNFIYMLVYLPLINHLKRVKNTEIASQLDPELKKVALSTFFMAILMGIGYLI